MPLPENDVHDLGEAIVRRWASETDLPFDRLERTAHGSVFGYRGQSFAAWARAAMDAMHGVGWNLPLQVGRVHVQTVRAGGDERLPLRLWWRMARDPLPWFVLRLVLDDAGEPLRTHLTHVDAARASFVFSTRRAFSGDEQLLGFTAQPEDALGAPEGVALRTRLLAVAEELPAYARHKIRHLRSCDLAWGRRRIVHTAERRAVTEAEHAALRDFALGLRSSMGTDEFLAGDDDLDVSVDGGEPTPPSLVELPWPASFGRTSLAVVTEDYRERQELDVEVRAPLVIADAANLGGMRWHYVGDLVSFRMVGSLEALLEWNPLPTHPVPLVHFDNAARLTQLFATARPRHPVALMHPEWGIDLNVARRWTPQPFSRAVLEWVAAIADAAGLARRFGLPATLSVVASQLRDERWPLRCLARFLDPTTSALEIRVVTARPLVHTDGLAAIVLTLAARLGDTVLSAIVQYSGRARWSAGTNELTIGGGEVRVLETSAEPHAEHSADDLRQEARWVAAEIAREARHEIVVFASDQAAPAEVMRDG
jgi:hypothetical protein